MPQAPRDKKRESMWERFPLRMRGVVSGSLEVAGRRGRAEGSPADLLESALREPGGAAEFLLGRLGVDGKSLLGIDGQSLLGVDGKSRLDALIGPVASDSPPPRPERASRFSAVAMHLLDVAAAEADRRGDRLVGTDHLLLAFTLGESDIRKTLADRGVDHARLLEGVSLWRQEMKLRTKTRGEPVAVAGRPRLWEGEPWIPEALRRVIELGVMGWKGWRGNSVGHPGFVYYPYKMYRWHRERGPVRRDSVAPVWIVTSYAETNIVLKDARFKKDPFAAERLPEPAREQLGVSEAEAGRSSAEFVSMLFQDPPDHTRVRSIFSKAFTPRRLEAFRPRIQFITDRLLDQAEARARGDGAKTIDVIRDLAYPLPVAVIAELLGFPPEDYEKIKHWSDHLALALSLNPNMEAQRKASRARDEISDYFAGVIKDLRAEPGDNLLSALLTGEAYGDRGERLDDNELLSNAVLLLAAGHETTTGLIGNSILALLRNPDQLADLRANLDTLLPAAVEELLRFDPPVQWTSRTAGEDILLGDVTIPRGQIVLASLGAANRDPAVFPDPDTLNLRREAGRHLAFGSGIHFCLGAALARWEAQAAIGSLIRRYPKLALPRQLIRWRWGMTLRGVERLKVTIA